MATRIGPVLNNELTTQVWVLRHLPRLIKALILEEEVIELLSCALGDSVTKTEPVLCNYRPAGERSQTKEGFLVN
jgi:hypothetical protein